MDNITMPMRYNAFKHRCREIRDTHTLNPYPYFKAFLLLFYPGNIYGFCRRCGCRVYDYMVPNNVWNNATGWNGSGILCYQCFCKISVKKGIYYRIVDKGYDKEGNNGG